MENTPLTHTHMFYMRSSLLTHCAFIVPKTQANKAKIKYDTDKKMENVQYYIVLILIIKDVFLGFIQLSQLEGFFSSLIG